MRACLCDWPDVGGGLLASDVGQIVSQINRRAYTQRSGRLCAMLDVGVFCKRHDPAASDEIAASCPNSTAFQTTFVIEHG